MGREGGREVGGWVGGWVGRTLLTSARNRDSKSVQKRRSPNLKPTRLILEAYAGPMPFLVVPVWVGG